MNNATITVRLNGTTIYAGESEPTADANWAEQARTMKDGDELTMHAGDRLHRAAVKRMA